MQYKAPRVIAPFIRFCTRFKSISSANMADLYAVLYCSVTMQQSEDNLSMLGLRSTFANR